jgi:hypothetical protein
MPEKLWQDIRRRLDESDAGQLKLSTGEIQEATGSENNLDQPWWWQMICNHTMISSVPPSRFGIHCKPHIKNNRVVSVTFSRIKQAS